MPGCFAKLPFKDLPVFYFLYTFFQLFFQFFHRCVLDDMNFFVAFNHGRQLVSVHTIVNTNYFFSQFKSLGNNIANTQTWSCGFSDNQVTFLDTTKFASVYLFYLLRSTIYAICRLKNHH